MNRRRPISDEKISRSRYVPVSRNFADSCVLSVSKNHALSNRICCRYDFFMRPAQSKRRQLDEPRPFRILFRNTQHAKPSAKQLRLYLGWRRTSREDWVYTPAVRGKLDVWMTRLAGDTNIWAWTASWALSGCRL
jgi:hypothetical protein